MRVRIRGIYATALTRLFTGGAPDAAREAGSEHTVVQASSAIRERFDRDLPTAPHDATVEASDDREGVAVSGTPDAVATLADRLAEVGIDALRWSDDAPRGAVFEGRVTETLGSGAVVDLGPQEGFLPFSATDARVETGDAVRVQVREPTPPWSDDRLVLDTDLAVGNGLLELVCDGASTADGGNSRGGEPGAAADRLDLLSADPPAGWRVRWEAVADDADFAVLDDALAEVGDRAAAIDAALPDEADAPNGDEERDAAPRVLWNDRATAWVWFGRASRFALDDHRREVTATMVGHHRIKAGDERASSAVDFAEAVCSFDATADDSTETTADDASGPTDDDAAFPFTAVADQFGPREGDTVAIEHGKPDGRSFALGRGTVTERDDAGVTVRREMRSTGTYDALGTERQPGDVATTKFVEDRWWYATVYRGDDGTTRGTYVNVCTPIEVFPDAVRYLDLHVDVIKRPDGTVERVDDDELDAAVASGHLTDALADRAREVAARVADGL